jgi:hypothetical protein
MTHVLLLSNDFVFAALGIKEKVGKKRAKITVK